MNFEVYKFINIFGWQAHRANELSNLVKFLQLQIFFHLAREVCNQINIYLEFPSPAFSGIDSGGRPVKILLRTHSKNCSKH